MTQNINPHPFETGVLTQQPKWSAILQDNEAFSPTEATSALHARSATWIVHNNEPPNDEAFPRLLTARQVAESFQISVRQVYRLVAKGELPRPMKIGRSSRWHPDALQGYLRKTSARGK